MCCNDAFDVQLFFVDDVITVWSRNGSIDVDIKLSSNSSPIVQPQRDRVLPSLASFRFAERVTRRLCKLEVIYKN